MAITQGDVGGGGSTNNICAINPADLVGTIGNLISRIEELEIAVSQLMGGNVLINQLSDLTQDAGTLLSGQFGGTLLTTLLPTLAKQSIWAKTGSNEFIESSGAEKDYGDVQELTTGTAVNNGAVARNALANYSVGQPSRTNPHGNGCYFTARFGVYVPGHPTTLVGMRARVGLGPFSMIDPAQNTDTPDGIWFAFEYSQPRGDATWKVRIQGQSVAAGPYVATMIDTGIPVVPIFTTAYYNPPLNYYDCYIRSEPGTNEFTFGMRDIISNATFEGSSAAPDQWTDASNPPISPASYQSGLGVWNNESGVTKQLWVQHAWAQKLLAFDVLPLF